MQEQHYSQFTDVEFLTLNNDLSSKGLRHPLWDLGQSLVICFCDCNQPLICRITLEELNIYKPCSRDCWYLPHLNSCWIKHSIVSNTETGSLVDLAVQSKCVWEGQVSTSHAFIQLPSEGAKAMFLFHCSFQFRLFEYPFVQGPCSGNQNLAKVVEGQIKYYFLDLVWAGGWTGWCRGVLSNLMVLWLRVISLQKAAAIVMLKAH